MICLNDYISLALRWSLFVKSFKKFLNYTKHRTFSHWNEVIRPIFYFRLSNLWKNMNWLEVMVWYHCINSNFRKRKTRENNIRKFGIFMITYYNKYNPRAHAHAQTQFCEKKTMKLCPYPSDSVKVSWKVELDLKKR